MRSIRLPQQLREHHGIGLDLNQHFRGDEPADLDHAGRRANVFEEFTMRPADLLPLVDVHNVHPGPYHILQCRSQLFQCCLDVLEGTNRLCIRIAFADNGAGFIGGCGTRDENELANTDRPGIADDRFPWCSAGIALSFHGLSSPTSSSPFATVIAWPPRKARSCITRTFTT